MKFKARLPNLTTQIFICLGLGIIVGYAYRTAHPDPVSIQTFSDNIQLLNFVFLRLIKMIIAPLVFSLLLVGISKVGDFKVVGRIGLKTVIYFTIATTVALIIGLIIVNIFEPGKALNQQQITSTAIHSKPFVAEEFLKSIFPESIMDSMSRNMILPIIVFVIFFAVAVASLKEKGKVIIDLFDAIAHAMLTVTSYVMKFSPIAVFSAISAVIATNGPQILQGYLKITVCFLGGLAFFVFGVLWLISTLMGIKFYKLLRHILEPIALAFSTASSEASMPKAIEGLEKFGCPNRIVSFVLPLGYSFNLDGSVMYMTFATVSIAQAYGIEMTLGQQITMMLMLLASSKGMAGVPKASLVVIAGMLEQFQIPLEGLGLILAIDWLLDMFRSATNVVGNAVATAVVSRWEGELNPHPEKIKDVVET